MNDDRDQGQKQDAGKVPAELTPVRAVEEMLRVLEFGAKKYAPNNWRKGISYNRVLAAIWRHWAAMMRGEDTDGETGRLHAACLMAEAAFLCEFQLEGRDALDDRYRPDTTTQALGTKCGIKFTSDPPDEAVKNTWSNILDAKRRYDREVKPPTFPASTPQKPSAPEAFTHRGFNFKPLGELMLQATNASVRVFRGASGWYATSHDDRTIVNQHAPERPTPELAVDVALAVGRIRRPTIEVPATMLQSDGTHGTRSIVFRPGVQRSGDIDVWRWGLWEIRLHRPTQRWSVMRHPTIIEGLGSLRHAVAEAALRCQLRWSRVEPRELLDVCGQQYALSVPSHGEGSDVIIWRLHPLSPNLNPEHARDQTVSLNKLGNWSARIGPSVTTGIHHTPSSAMRALLDRVFGPERLRKSKAAAPGLTAMWSFDSGPDNHVDPDRIRREVGHTHFVHLRRGVTPWYVVRPCNILQPNTRSRNLVLVFDNHVARYCFLKRFERRHLLVNARGVIVEVKS